MIAHRIFYDHSPANSMIAHRIFCDHSLPNSMGYFLIAYWRFYDRSWDISDRSLAIL